MKFEELTSSKALLHAIQEMGWKEPTPIQAKAIPLARAGKDVIGIAQTGTGKTASFLIPALEKQAGLEGLHTLILCPTRELAQQVAADARELAKRAQLFVGEIVGGVSYGPQIRDLRAGFDVLVATPGRLLDHLERGNIDLSEIRTLILDEADRMLDMGFRPQIDAILARVPKQRQTMLYSATMPNGVHAMAIRIMQDPARVEVAPPGTVADRVEQVIYPVRAEKKPALLVELLQQKHWDQVLVFSATKTGADVLLSRLRHAGISVAVLHGDKDMRQRKKALDQFVDGKVTVLVATDVAQRGLDIDGISHVVNYDVPRNPEDYVHRIGRTARAGASGTAVTFMTAGEVTTVRDVERLIGREIEKISLEGYDWDSRRGAPETRPTAAVNRAGHRFGTRKTAELTPEQLQALLSFG